MNEQHDAAAVRAFPAGIPLLTILIGIGLNHLWPIDPGLPKVARYATGAVIVTGAFLCLGLWSVVLFRRTGQSEKPMEAYLERKFGAQYLAYKRRVRLSL